MFLSKQEILKAKKLNIQHKNLKRVSNEECKKEVRMIRAKFNAKTLVSGGEDGGGRWKQKKGKKTINKTKTGSLKRCLN